MKVISTPTTDDWSVKCDCSNCDSILEIISSDVICSYFSEYDYDSFHVVCPVCFAHISLNEYDLPKLVKSESKRRFDKQNSNK